MAKTERAKLKRVKAKRVKAMADTEQAEPVTDTERAKPIVLLVEDVKELSDALAHHIILESKYKFQVLQAQTVQDALNVAKAYPAVRFIVLDIWLPDYAPFDKRETDDGREAGLRLIREFSEVLPEARIYVKSGAPNPNVLEHALRFKSVIRATGKANPEEIAQLAEQVYQNRGPNMLIMHGHDEATLSALQLFIQNTLKLGVPHVLRKLPDDGRAIIEKLEDYAQRTDLVFALLTDDDGTGGLKRRARQNVIFEVGYFMGAFGRKSGRLILLVKGDLETPSDWDGILKIDVSKGIEAASERIREELRNWWGTT